MSNKEVANKLRQIRKTAYLIIENKIKEQEKRNQDKQDKLNKNKKIREAAKAVSPR